VSVFQHLVFRARFEPRFMATPRNNGAAADVDRSQTPRRMRLSPSPVHRHGRSGQLGRDQSAAPVWMVREVSGLFPLLTKTNHSDLSSMMHVMLCTQGLWTATKEGVADDIEDQMEMEALLQGVPLEMSSTLASKASAKAVWDQLESS
jgi:hypothetical protein